MVAPSVINGIAYVMSDSPITGAPKWLVDLILSHRTDLKSINKSGTVEEGGRNTFIYSVAVECKRNGLSLEEATLKVQEANASCYPPLDEAELKKIINSAFSHNPSIPKEIAELNRHHAVVNVGGKCRIMKQVVDPDTGLDDIEFSSPADFKQF